MQKPKSLLQSGGITHGDGCCDGGTEAELVSRDREGFRNAMRIYKETRAWPALVVSLDGRPHHALRDADRGPRFRLPVKMACRGSRVADVWVRDGFEKLPVDLETLDRSWFGSTGSR
jgi:hypothetical protein